MAHEVDPFGVVREDESSKGLIKNGLNGKLRRLGRLAGGVRDKITMAEMKARMSALWKDGETYIEIANKVSDEFGLEGDARFKANGIHYHIKSLLAEWRERSMLSVDEKQALVLARYAQLEDICTNALFASMEGKETRYYERQLDKARSKKREQWIREEIKREREENEGNIDVGQDNGGMEDALVNMQERIKEYSRVEMSAGEAKWMAFLIDINHKRAQLWNLLAKREVTNEDQEMARLSDEDRTERMAAVLRSALMRATEDKGNLAPPAPLGGPVEEKVFQYNEELEDEF